MGYRTTWKRTAPGTFEATISGSTYTVQAFYPEAWGAGRPEWTLDIDGHWYATFTRKRDAQAAAESYL